MKIFVIYCLILIHGINGLPTTEHPKAATAVSDGEFS